MTEDQPDDVVEQDDAPPLTDRENALLGQLEADLERVLGVGVGIGSIEIEGGGPVVVRATLLAEGKIREVEAEGPTLEAACAAVVDKAAEVRLDGAFWRIVGDI